jgi:hypothetical protein
MTREEREQMIEQLQFEVAEGLAEVARREQRTAELENQECDALLERLAQRRQQTNNSADVVYKEFPLTRQLPPPEPPPMLATQAWVADAVEIIGDETFRAIAEMRAELRKQFATEIGELRAEIEVLRSVAKQNGRTKRRA